MLIFLCVSFRSVHFLLFIISMNFKFLEKMFCKHFTTFLHRKDEKQAYFITSKDTCSHLYNKQWFVCKFSVFYISTVK